MPPAIRCYVAAVAIASSVARAGPCADLNGRYMNEGVAEYYHTGLYDTPKPLLSDDKYWLDMMAPASIDKTLVSTEWKEGPTQSGAQGIRIMRRPYTTHLADAVLLAVASDSVKFTYSAEEKDLVSFALPLGEARSDKHVTAKEWRCEGDQLVRRYEERIGAEDFSGTSNKQETISRDGQGNLVWEKSAVTEKYQLFVFPAGTGTYRHRFTFRPKVATQ